MRCLSQKVYGVIKHVTKQPCRHVSGSATARETHTAWSLRTSWNRFGIVSGAAAENFLKQAAQRFCCNDAEHLGSTVNWIRITRKYGNCHIQLESLLLDLLKFHSSYTHAIQLFIYTYTKCCKAMQASNY